MISQLIVSLALASSGGGVVTYAVVADSTYIAKLSSCSSDSQVASDLNTLTANYGGAVVKTWLTPICAGQIKKLSTTDAANMGTSSLVSFVEQNGQYSVADTQQLSGSNANLHLDRLDQRQDTADQKFRFPHDGAGMKIFIVDTGIQVVGDMASRIDASLGFSVFAGSSPTNDLVGHGTAMASMAASSTYGVAKGASLVPIKVSDNQTITLSNLISALQYILNLPSSSVDPTRAVINMSVYSSAMSTGTGMVESLVDQLKTKGYVIVAAAGNSDADVSSYSPARSPNVITVGASTLGSPGSRWVDSPGIGSNYGAAIDFFAPSIDIKAYTTTGVVLLTAGQTSAAAALTSGAVATLRQSQLTGGSPTDPSTTQSRLESAGTSGALSSTSLNGSINRLLFTDVRPSFVDSVSVSNGFIFCTSGIAPFNRPFVVTVYDTIIDSSTQARYLAAGISAPTGCTWTNPFAVPTTIYLQKRSSSNAVLWTTTLLSGVTIGEAITRINFDLTNANLLVTGNTQTCGAAACGGGFGALVAKVNASTGAVVFNRQIDSAGIDQSAAMIETTFNFGSGPTTFLTVAGTTSGTLGVPVGLNDGFIARLDRNTGATQMVTQFGTNGNDSVSDLAFYNTQMIVAGTTSGTMPGLSSAGGNDGFVSTVLALPSSNFVAAAAQFGTPGNEVVGQLRTVPDGSSPFFIVAGTTTGTFPNNTSAGGTDAFAARFNDAPSSSPIWIQQFGTPSEETTPKAAMTADDFFVNSGNTLFKISRSSGKRAWSESVAGASLSIDGIRHAMTCDSNLCTRRRAY